MLLLILEIVGLPIPVLFEVIAGVGAEVVDVVTDVEPVFIRSRPSELFEAEGICNETITLAVSKSIGAVWFNMGFMTWLVEVLLLLGCCCEAIC